MNQNHLILSLFYRLLAFYLVIAYLYYERRIPTWIAYVLLTLSTLYVLMFMYVFMAFTSEVWGSGNMNGWAKATVVIVMLVCVGILVLDVKLMQLFHARRAMRSKGK